MKLSRAQKQMVEDGFPAGLLCTQAQRAAWWDKNPPKSLPMFELTKTRNEDAATIAFRASLDERKRLKSLAGIARMKTRFATKAIDHSKMRWDPRKVKFVPITGDKPITTSPPAAVRVPIGSTPRVAASAPIRLSAGGEDWSRVNKDTARYLAELNGVWDDKYARLSGGLLVMTVTNRLKGLIKKGGEVKWR